MEKITKETAEKIKEWVFNKDYSDSELSYRIEISEFNTFIDSLTESDLVKGLKEIREDHGKEEITSTIRSGYMIIDEEKKKIEPLDFLGYVPGQCRVSDVKHKINEIIEWINNH